MKNEQLYKMEFSRVYSLYVQKAEKKGRTTDEVNAVICWLTGYDQLGLQAQLKKTVSLETFFAEAPQINPNAGKITGTICGVRIEEISDPLMRKIRWMDKLIDELAKGRPLEKILRD